MSSSMSQSPTPASLSDAQVIDTTARWLDDDSDVVLGCECANPALQIERWGQESATPYALHA